MKPTKLRLFAGTLAVLGLLVAAGFLAAPKPKLYQGKTVRQWVAMLDMRVDYQKQREEAAIALVRIGPDALPEIQHILAWRLGPMHVSFDAISRGFERILARDDTREMLDSLLLHIGTAYETEIWGQVRKLIVLDVINDLLALTIKNSLLHLMSSD